MRCSRPIVAFAQSKLAGASPVPEAMSEAPPQAAPAGSPAAAGVNPMAAVQQQLAALKDAIAKDPNNFDALVQLGDMYMDAAKFPQAAEYLERAVAARDDANVRTDLGICYKQSGQMPEAHSALALLLCEERLRAHGLIQLGGGGL